MTNTKTGNNPVCTDHLQNGYNLNIHYLDQLEQACLEMQEKIRRTGVRDFNVWLWLEKQFRDHYSSHHINGRKPPKAITIQQWCRNDSISVSSKMGTEDFRLICQFINNHIPIISYYEYSISYFSKEIAREVIEDIKALNSHILNLAKENGDLADEFNKDIMDDILTGEEAERIKKKAQNLIDSARQIINACDNKSLLNTPAKESKAN